MHLGFIYVIELSWKWDENMILFGVKEDSFLGGISC